MTLLSFFQVKVNWKVSTMQFLATYYHKKSQSVELGFFIAFHNDPISCTYN